VQFTKLHTKMFLIGAVCQIVTRWHHNETLTVTLTLNHTVTLRITVIYAVKDDTEIKLLLVL